MENTRRSFLKKVSAAGIGAAGLAMAGNAGATTTAAEPQKKKTAGKDDGKLRFGFIGTGSRCHEHINNVLAIPGNKIVAICDIQQGPIDSTLKHIAKFNVPAPKVYKGGEREFENMLNNEEFDCVIIASPWVLRQIRRSCASAFSSSTKWTSLEQITLMSYFRASSSNLAFAFC